MAVVANFPLFGSGGETFRYWETMLNQSTEWNSSVTSALRADNEFLDVWAEYGTGGLLSLLAIAVAVLWHGFRLARRDGLAAGAYMALIAVIAHSIGDFGLRIPASGVFATIVAALLCSIPISKRDRAGKVSRSVGQQKSIGSAMPRSVTGQVSAIAVGAVCVLIAVFLVNEKRRYAAAYGLQAFGFRALQANDLGKCVDAMQASTLVVPEDVEGHITAARTILFAASKTEDGALKDAMTRTALKLCIMARDLCPLAYEPQLWLAQHDDQLQAGDTRLAYFERANRLHPSDVDISFALGGLFYDSQRYAEAWPCWHASLTYSAKHLPQILERARSHLNPEQILASIVPDDLKRLYDAALQAEEVGQPSESQLYWQRVLELLPAKSDDPEEEATNSEFAARVFQKLGQTEKSIEAYRRAISCRPSATPWRLALVQQLMTLENYEDALRELRPVLVFEPDNKVAIGLRVRITQLQKEVKR